jgi:transcriptional regulator with XRE-family HTH domain
MVTPVYFVNTLYTGETELKAFFIAKRKKIKMDYTAHAIAELYAVAKHHKIKAYEIANEAGITRVTLSNWKNKRSEPMLGAYLAAFHALERIIAARAVD